MPIIRYYSAIIAGGLLLVTGILVIVRRHSKARDWLIFSGGMAVLVAGWISLRPVPSRRVETAGQPVLLELQSPYCLLCLALKSSVDRQEKQWQGSLMVRRVNLRSVVGQELAAKFGVEVVPTFIYFDKEGNERWRSVGGLDAQQVQASLETHATAP